MEGRFLDAAHGVRAPPDAVGTGFFTPVLAVAMVDFPFLVLHVLGSVVLFVGHGHHFLERGDALLHLPQPGLPQVAHAFAPRLVGDFDRVAAAHDQPPHLVGDRHHLIDADAALVAGAPAAVAADRPVGRPIAVQVTSKRSPRRAAPSLEG